MKQHYILKYFLITCLLFSSFHLLSQCPRGINNCKGQCPRFVDVNNDGYCDFSTITEVVTMQLKQVKDTTNKKTENILIVKDNSTSTDKKELKKNITKAEIPTNKDLPLKEKKIANEPNKIQPTIIKVEENKSNLKQSASYDLIFVSILTFSLYFTTFFLAKYKKIKKKTHRKIWNMLLLLTFLASCLFGFFLVLQINYHFLFSIFRTLLYWHVEIGISMTLIAVFHILWHLKYFKTYFKSTTSDDNCL